LITDNHCGYNVLSCGLAPKLDDWNTINLEVNRPVIDLPIRIIQLNSESTLSIDLNLNGSASNVIIDTEHREKIGIVGARATTESQSLLQIQTLNDLQASLDMIITTASDDRLVAQVNMQKPGETISEFDPPNYQSETPYTFVIDANTECSSDVVLCQRSVKRYTLNETPTDYVPIFLTASATANLVGVDPIVFSFSGKRISDRLFSLDQLKIEAGENITNLQSTLASGVVNWDGVFSSLSAVNNSSIHFRMNTDTAGIRSGQVTDIFGNSIAEIVDENGILSVGYADGAREVF
jgi:hypothetical protein